MSFILRKLAYLGSSCNHNTIFKCPIKESFFAFIFSISTDSMVYENNTCTRKSCNRYNRYNRCKRCNRVCENCRNNLRNRNSKSE